MRAIIQVLIETVFITNIAIIIIIIIIIGIIQTADYKISTFAQIHYLIAQTRNYLH